MNFPMKILKLLLKSRTKNHSNTQRKLRSKITQGIQKTKTKSDKQHQQQLATHNRQIRLQSRHET